MEKYFSFTGTSTRSEYWGVNVIAAICAFILAFFGTIVVGTGENAFLIAVGAAILVATFAGALWLSIATAVRRCRDAGLNVWWAIAICIPYIGWIVSIVLGCIRTNEGSK